VRLHAVEACRDWIWVAALNRCLRSLQPPQRLTPSSSWNAAVHCLVAGMKFKMKWLQVRCWRGRHARSRARAWLCGCVGVCEPGVHSQTVTHTACTCAPPSLLLRLSMWLLDCKHFWPGACHHVWAWAGAQTQAKPADPAGAVAVVCALGG